jgi:choline dehydrogenase-like flavoprotein
MSETFDFLAVGAGSSGCVIADQLSASGRFRVLLLEAGGCDKNFWIGVPKGVARLVTDPKQIWTYAVTQPREFGAGAQEVWIRGKGIGGSSSINGMIWSCGEPSDYEAREAMGCAGWNARLRVNGVTGVRVADCSVMPSPVTGNTNAPAMALGLRASELILADRA